ncbi:Uncharacterised protein [BD1-7 clade bacterium]|uniref:TfoX N-terminal domain-containing protein n=1 Tax=BD1-7 clade bacterium TaxID=2029982 RepID=A0A5S9N5V8_9GAMM|nr:Uncharacterised protein [BD1-7 clade bacterium]
MAYDEGLAERLSMHFSGRPDVDIKRMFGGLCFMVSEHMCCGILGEMLMARVGPDHYDDCLNDPHVDEMDFTGKPMKGLVYVSPDGYESDADLVRWVDLCEAFIRTLPPKPIKPPKKQKTRKAP